MTTQQPEALRLADALNSISGIFPLEVNAANELRRLYAENGTLRHKLQTLEELGDAGDDVQLLRMGYAAARLEIASLQAQLEAVGAGGVSALMGASQSRQAGAEPVAQWQKRHPNKEYGLWQNTDEGDAKWWRDKAGTPGWEARALYAAPQPAAQALDAQDAARYRWVKEQAEFFPLVMDGTGLLCANAEEAEAEIDAAIAAQQGGA